MRYAGTPQSTWDKRGAKQVTVGIVGSDEKRAFTLMVGVSMNGEVLPFQAIFTRQDPNRSLPSRNSPRYAEAQNLGFRFEVSKTTTYWSTQETMRLYVTHILAPYFERHPKERGVPDQRCLWLIDVWSVHRSAEFRQCMKKNYPWIIINYVPGGCTRLAQPCDVGIQRPLKHAMRRTVQPLTHKLSMRLFYSSVPARARMRSSSIRQSALCVTVASLGWSTPTTRLVCDYQALASEAPWGCLGSCDRHGNTFTSSEDCQRAWIPTRSLHQCPILCRPQQLQDNSSLFSVCLHWRQVSGSSFSGS